MEFANESIYDFQDFYGMIMNFTFGNGTICEANVDLIVSKTYKTIISLEILASSLAFVPNAILACIIWKVGVFPANLRLLLGFMSFVLAWLSIGIVVKNAYILATPKCAYDFSQFNCKIMDLILYSIALPSTFYILTALCIERLVATLMYKQYDSAKWHNKPYLGAVLVITVLAVSLFITGWGAVGLSKEILIPICESTTIPSTSISPYMSQIYLSIEILDAILTLFVYCYNRIKAKEMSINRARFNLSARFLIDQNVQVNSMVVPSMLLHLLFYAPSYLTSSINKFFVQDITNKAVINRLSVLIRLIFAVIHPIIAFRFNAHLRQQLLVTPLGPLLQYAGISGPKPADNGIGKSQQTEKHDHFDHMDKLWDTIKKQEPAKKVIKPSKVAWKDQKEEK